VNAPQRVSKSRRFFSDLIAKRHLQVKSVPGSPRMPSGFRGNLGWIGGPVKSAYGRVDGGKGQASRLPHYAGVVTENRSDGVVRRPIREGRRDQRLAWSGRRRKEAVERASSGRAGVTRWRPKGRFAASRPDEPYGPAKQRGSLRRGQTGTHAVLEAPDVIHPAPSQTRPSRGPVEFGDAASGRSTPSGFAACSEDSCKPDPPEVDGVAPPATRRELRGRG